MSDFASVLHALALEPPVARPGEVVRAVVRARNHGLRPAQAVSVVFAPGPAFEALEPAEVTLAPVAPGDDVVASCALRVATPALDGGYEVDAALSCDGATFATNRCTLTVRARAAFGEDSGTWVDALDEGTVRIRAAACNVGDGAARDVRLVVPVPAGCVRLDAGGETTDPAETLVGRLEPGETIALAFEARIAAPRTQVTCEGARLWIGGDAVPLDARARAVLTPALAPPRLSILPQRRRVEVRVMLENAGWADDESARLHVTLPAALRPDVDAITVDGAAPVARASKRRSAARCIERTPLAAVARDGGTITVSAAVRARGSALVVIPAAWKPGASVQPAIEPVVARLGEHEVTVPCAYAPHRSVRVRVTGIAHSAAPGDETAATIVACNYGDEAATLALRARCGMGHHIEESEEHVVTVPPGTSARVPVRVRIPRALRDGDLAEIIVAIPHRAADLVVHDDGGAVLRVHERPRAQPDGECAETPRVDEEDAFVAARLDAPVGVDAGVRFPIALQVDVARPAASLVVRVAETPLVRLVPGSSSVDARPIADRGARSLLADGLTLRGIAAGTSVIVRCEAIADPSDEPVVVRASVFAAELAAAEAECAVRVAVPPAFVAQPAGLAYYLDAPTAPAPVAQPPAVVLLAPVDCVEVAPPAREEPPEHVVMPPVLARSAAADGAIPRLLALAPPDGLVAHVLAIRALLPDTARCADSALDGAVASLHAAVSDVFDRLAVKLRIPGFLVDAADLEDRPMRAALAAVLDRLGIGVPDAPRYGAPSVLRALLALALQCETDAAGDGAHAYLAALDDALAAYDDLPPDVFDDALARGRSAALDDERAAFVTALRTPGGRRPW